MKYVTANELKRNGISVVNEAVAEYGEAVISVRGKSKYVILDTETYDHLRECELEVALLETRKAIEAGDFVEETAEEHIARISKDA
jgi:prevent-host-death family protein